MIANLRDLRGIVLAANTHELALTNEQFKEYKYNYDKILAAPNIYITVELNQCNFLNNQF